MINAIIDKLNNELELAVAASQRAHQTATDKQNIPDNKYDTLALEAAYLAHGQSMRIAELQQALQTYQNFKAIAFNQASCVAMGAQVSLETDGEIIKHYFIGPCSGGLSVQWANNSHSPLQSLANNMVDTVQVLTPQAPLGKLIMGSFVNDEVFIEREGLRKTYRIIAIK